MSKSVTKEELFDGMAEKGTWREFKAEDMPKVERLLGTLALRPGMTVFEPGCGTGRLTALMLERVLPGGRVIANDISPAMIRLGRRRGLGRGVRWLLGPVESVELECGSVDRIVCLQSFPHFENKATVLAMFRRIVKDKGMLAIVHFVDRRRVNRIHSEQPVIRRDILPDKRTMLKLLKEAGFVPMEFTSSKAGYWLFALPDEG